MELIYKLFQEDGNYINIKNEDESLKKYSTFKVNYQDIIYVYDDEYKIDGITYYLMNRTDIVDKPIEGADE